MTEIVAVCCVVTVDEVKVGMLPVPDAAKPIDGLLFVQSKVTVPCGLVKLIAVTAVLLHSVIEFTASTFGVPQFTAVHVNVSGSTQVPPTGVIVMVTLSPGLKEDLVKLVDPIGRVPVIAVPVLLTK